MWKEEQEAVLAIFQAALSGNKTLLVSTIDGSAVSTIRQLRRTMQTIEENLKERGV